MASELNGAHYIGASVDYYHRWMAWRSSIRRSVSKYTKEFFAAYSANKLTFFLLETCPEGSAKCYLNTREQYWMDQFPNRINRNKFATPVGNTNMRGRKQTPDSRRKMSVAQMGNKNALGHSYTASEDARKKLSQTSKGRVHSLQTRAKLSQINKGNKNCLGRKLSAETCKKLSDAAKRRKPISEETREKLRLSHLGKGHPAYKMTEEIRNKMRIAKIGNHYSHNYALKKKGNKP